MGDHSCYECGRGGVKIHIPKSWVVPTDIWVVLDEESEVQGIGATKEQAIRQAVWIRDGQPAPESLPKFHVDCGWRLVKLQCRNMLEY